MKKVDKAPLPEEVKINLKGEYLSSLKISPIPFKGNIEVAREDLKELIDPIKKITRSQ